MTIVKGLKNINALVDKPKYEGTGSKVRWLKLADGQSVKIRFIEELDEDSSNYNDKRGLALVVKEHTNPKDYKRRALDTMEAEGRDWAEEMHRKDPKAGWRARLRFYCNVLVEDGLEEPYVAVWAMGVSKQSAFNTIREYALETGSISNLTWKLKRNGQGTETSYTLIPGVPDKEPYDWSKVEPFPLEKALNKIPYAEQEAFYLGFDTPSAGSSNIEW
ncbi:MAG: hypothetical protein EBY68_06470 [Actinobacteria bacterium]|jgi:hypothetical protein|nr:hypothetical protein [Actinomycetota bacterium]